MFIIKSDFYKNRYYEICEKLRKLTFMNFCQFSSFFFETLSPEFTKYPYKVELDDGTIVDPLRAVHVVGQISGREILTRFWDTDVRLEWELTIETCKVCEVLSSKEWFYKPIFFKIK